MLRFTENEEQIKKSNTLLCKRIDIYSTLKILTRYEENSNVRLNVVCKLLLQQKYIPLKVQHLLKSIFQKMYLDFDISGVVPDKHCDQSHPMIDELLGQERKASLHLFHS